MNIKLHYITFQKLPNISANSIQTMKMAKYFNKSKDDFKIVIPSNKDRDAIDILDYYNLEKDLEIEKTKYLSYDNKYFSKILFILSHFLWGLRVSRKYQSNDRCYIFTRSCWIQYFMAKKGFLTILEIHKKSKTTSFVLNKLGDKKNAGYIFTNKLLKDSFTLSNVQAKNSIILSGAFDHEDFENIKYNPKKNTGVFMGRLLRYGKERNIQFLIDAFSQPDLRDYSLYIIGGPTSANSEIKKYIEINKIQNIKAYDQVSQKDLMKMLSEIDIGLLTNAPTEDSKLFTSPLKFFEYLKSGLKVLAVDFPAHRELPFVNDFNLFVENDKNDFINKFIDLSNMSKPTYKNLEEFSYKSRVSKVFKLYARLEGLEPPTL